MWRELRRPGIFIRAAACLTTAASLQRNPSMGFNKRKMKAQRAAAAEKVAAAKRATEAQILEDASRLVSAWNERQAKRMPMLFSPTIGCALKARHWFLWVVVLPAAPLKAVDLRPIDRHPWSAIRRGLIPSLSVALGGDNAPFAGEACPPF